MKDVVRAFFTYPPTSPPPPTSHSGQTQFPETAVYITSPNSAKLSELQQKQFILGNVRAMNKHHSKQLPGISGSSEPQVLAYQVGGPTDKSHHT